MGVKNTDRKRLAVKNKNISMSTYEFIGDLIAYFASLFLAYFFCEYVVKKLGKSEEEDIRTYIIIMCFCIFFVILVFVHYNEAEKKTRTSLVLGSAMITAVVTVGSSILMIISKNSMLASRWMLISFICISFVLDSCVRILLHRLKRKRDIYSKSLTHVGLITKYDKAGKWADVIEKKWGCRLHGIFLTDKKLKGSSMFEDEVVANSFGEYVEWAKNDILDEVIVDIERDAAIKSGIDIDEFVSRMKEMGVDVHITTKTLRAYSKYYCEVTDFDGQKMLTIADRDYNQTLLMLKRGMDILGGLVGSIVTIPLLLIVAIPLKLESKGPLIYTQERVGLNGRYFKIYKIRSMYADADKRKNELEQFNEMSGPVFKMKDDPRITKVGKFIRKTSIDEFPQFFNVLKGDMSLVGTRPPTKDEFKTYESAYKRRLSMKPGITGLWQINGRNEVEDFDEIIKYDLEYIDNWSLAEDIRILVKTVPAVFGKTGAR